MPKLSTWKTIDLFHYTLRQALKNHIPNRKKSECKAMRFLQKYIYFNKQKILQIEKTCFHLLLRLSGKINIVSLRINN